MPTTSLLLPPVPTLRFYLFKLAPTSSGAPLKYVFTGTSASYLYSNTVNNANNNACKLITGSTYGTVGTALTREDVINLYCDWLAELSGWTLRGGTITSLRHPSIRAQVAAAINRTFPKCDNSTAPIQSMTIVTALSDEGEVYACL